MSCDITAPSKLSFSTVTQALGEAGLAKLSVTSPSAVLTRVFDSRRLHLKRPRNPGAFRFLTSVFEHRCLHTAHFWLTIEYVHDLLELKERGVRTSS